ncbi:COesterase domain containing protein, partial [Asbolus verrucosus]
PPVPTEKWSGVYNATADGPVCPQPTNDPVSEDCLMLNVYTTKLPAGGNNPKRPEFGIDPILIWKPVIEEDFGQERFLHDHPVRLIENGMSNATLLKKLNDNFEKYAPISFLYERGTEKSKQVSRAVRKFYFGDEPLSNASLKGLAKLYADTIGFQVDRAVELLSEKCSKPVYYYEFTYQGRYSHNYLPGTTTPLGVVHHDDLIYSFYISPLFPFFNESYPEAEMVETLTSIWTNFARTG